MTERDLAAARDRLALPSAEQPAQVQPLISYHYALARVSAAQGNLEESLNSLLECERLARRMREPNPAANLPWRSDAATLIARLGDRDHAHELVREDLRLARQFGAPHALGIALRAAGLIEGGTTGLDHLTDAVSVFDGSGIDLELARTLTELGAAPRRARHRSAARAPLRRGLDLATRCGALALIRRAREELLATGARPRRDCVRGAAALTASELRVARMAADGMTNREIAQALFITVRTVTTHLGHAYQQLDITSREQLADKLTARTAPAIPVN